MAVNVYMVFFFSANPNNFLQYWYAYFIVCYGIPLIPALWLLLVRDGANRGVYGDATVRFTFLSPIGHANGLLDMVLDRQRLVRLAYLHVLSANLGLHCLVLVHLCRSWILRLQTT